MNGVDVVCTFMNLRCSRFATPSITPVSPLRNGTPILMLDHPWLVGFQSRGIIIFRLNTSVRACFELL